MTTRPGTATDHASGFVRLPDPPERRPEDMTSFDHLNATGSIHHLIRHFGNIETTIIAGEGYISPEPTPDWRGLMAPDLLIAFNAGPEAYRGSNGYVISEQGKPRTSSWKSPHPAPATAMSPKRETATLPWESPSIGDSTPPGASTTARPWQETGSSKESTSPS